MLGLAHNLNATAVLSIIMALISFCLIWESVTSLQKCAKFWETWVDTVYPEKTNNQIQVEYKHEDELPAP